MLAQLWKKCIWLSPSAKGLQSRNSQNAPKSSVSNCHASRAMFAWGTAKVHREKFLS